MKEIDCTNMSFKSAIKFGMGLAVGSMIIYQGMVILSRIIEICFVLVLSYLNLI